MKHLTAAAALLVIASSAAAAQLAGTVSHVRDGDTFEVDGVAVRLQGVAAPERDELGGLAALAFMQDAVDGQVMRCELTGERNHDRLIGICRLWNGRDIGEMIISAGFARDCPHFSRGRYAGAEEIAAQNGSRIRQNYRLPKYCGE